MSHTGKSFSIWVIKHGSILALLALVFVSCGGNISTKGRKLVREGEYVRAIELYTQQISKNPDKKDTYRDLAYAYYKKGDFTNALDAVSKANPADLSSYICLGLIYEAIGKNEQAIKTFGKALNYNPSKETQRIIRSHLDGLIRSNLRSEIEGAISSESEIDPVQIPQNTIAVVKFDGSLLSPDISPIAAGIAEFTMVDLGKVDQLRLVERLKVQLLLKELELGQTQNVDPSQAPRVGRLLGSRSVVTGKLTDAGTERFRLDGALVNTVESSSRLTDPGEAGINMEQILSIEKAMVFNILQYLGIEPSDENRDSINVVPTESLEAFLAYSRGIELFQQGRYDEATKQFEMALRIDPGFGLAGTQLVNSQTAANNRQFGSATPAQIEETFYQSVESGITSNGQMLTNFIDDTDILEPGDNNPTKSTTKPPQVSSTASARVNGNLDGDR